MIYEHRTYRVTAGKAPEFLSIYETEGLGIIAQHPTRCAYWVTESGPLNSLVNIWRYDSYEHRTSQRAKLAADPAWQAFVPRILPYLEYQESMFLNPAAFSPER